MINAFIKVVELYCDDDLLGTLERFDECSFAITIEDKIVGGEELIEIGKLVKSGKLNKCMVTGEDMEKEKE